MRGPGVSQERSDGQAIVLSQEHKGSTLSGNLFTGTTPYGIGKNERLLPTGDAGSSCTGPSGTLECRTEQG
jgi:hypothetical protein